MKSKLFLPLFATLQLSLVTCLLKTCRPSFQERFLSGGDQIHMRWEFCTKMIFKKDGFAEWHSWATYRHQDYFKKLYTNFLMEGRRDIDDPMLDMNKHLIQIDLAIYDELQWQKIMLDVEKAKLIRASELSPNDQALKDKVERMTPPMSCHERLSHAIEIDKIKIYPNHNMVVEKTKRRNIGESFEERARNKEENNEYTSYGNSSQENVMHQALDTERMHNKYYDGRDQTFYFALADCDGSLEIFQDEEKRDHLLGLSTLWHDIDNRDFEGYEDTKKKGMDYTLRRQMHEAEEAQGLMDTSDPNSIQEAMQSIEDMKTERGNPTQDD